MNHPYFQASDGAAQVSIYDLLRGAAPFASQDDAFVRAIASSSRLVRTYAGQALIEEGEVSPDLYYLVSGRIVIQLESISPHAEIGINRVSPGELVGEITLFADGPRTATAITTEPSLLVAIDGPTVQRLCHERPEQGFAFYRCIGACLAERLREMNVRVMNMIRARYF